MARRFQLRHEFDAFRLGVAGEFRHLRGREEGFAGVRVHMVARAVARRVLRTLAEEGAFQRVVFVVGEVQVEEGAACFGEGVDELFDDVRAVEVAGDVQIQPAFARAHGGRCGVGGVVLHVEGEGFLGGEAARVGRGDGQFHRRLAGVVEVLSGFEFQRAVARHFKARVAGFVGMAVAAVRVVRR